MNIAPPVIKEIVSQHERVDAFDCIRQLREHLTLDQYLSLVDEMVSRGYRMFALYREEKPISVAGVEVMTNLYNLRHLWIYELVTDAAERSKGYGTQLLQYLEDFARQESCSAVVVSSGLSRIDAHRFYGASGYEGVSTVFRKKLDV
jgi:GNAT superfamily N-acetyltransferase